MTSTLMSLTQYSSKECADLMPSKHEVSHKSDLPPRLPSHFSFDILTYYIAAAYQAFSYVVRC